MKMLSLSLFALFVIGSITTAHAETTPVGSAFTYQGQLYDENKVGSGQYDFLFRLYSHAADTVGYEVGVVNDLPGVQVLDGNFTVQLDFGPNAFNGSASWLEIAVRPSGLEPEPAYTVMDPRQPLTPTPYALYALNTPEGPTLAAETPLHYNPATNTIGLNAGTSSGDLMTWNGNNWISQPVQDLNLSNMQPYLTVNFIIALQGTFPSRNSSEPFLAQIIMFGGNFNPRGWALCDGQLLSISQNSALFSLLGTTFGGDGRTTFGLPDLRGRVPVHAGTGPGLSQRRLGSKGGTETVRK